MWHFSLFLLLYFLQYVKINNHFFAIVETKTNKKTLNQTLLCDFQLIY